MTHVRSHVIETTISLSTLIFHLLICWLYVWLYICQKREKHVTSLVVPEPYDFYILLHLLEMSMLLVIMEF